MPALATPPWFIDDRVSTAHLGGRDTLLICSRPDPPYGETEIVAVAYRGYEDGPSWTNARMLAAAPELFSALLALTEAINRGIGDMSLVFAAELAIEKATRGSPEKDCDWE